MIPIDMNQEYAEYEAMQASSGDVVASPIIHIDPAEAGAECTVTMEVLPSYSEQDPATICKVVDDWKLKTCEAIYFDSIQQITKEGYISAGAILFEISCPSDEPDGIPITREIWIPKKLCSNIDLESNVVHVWDMFVKEHPLLSELV